MAKWCPHTHTQTDTLTYMGKWNKWSSLNVEPTWWEAIRLLYREGVAPVAPQDTDHHGRDHTRCVPQYYALSK